MSDELSARVRRRRQRTYMYRLQTTLASILSTYRYVIGIHYVYYYILYTTGTSTYYNVYTCNTKTKSSGVCVNISNSSVHACIYIYCTVGTFIVILHIIIIIIALTHKLYVFCMYFDLLLRLCLRILLHYYTSCVFNRYVPLCGVRSDVRRQCLVRADYMEKSRSRPLYEKKKNIVYICTNIFISVCRTTSCVLRKFVYTNSVMSCTR